MASMSCDVDFRLSIPRPFATLEERRASTIDPFLPPDLTLNLLQHRTLLVSDRTPTPRSSAQKRIRSVPPRLVHSGASMATLMRVRSRGGLHAFRPRKIRSVPRTEQAQRCAARIDEPRGRGHGYSSRDATNVQRAFRLESGPAFPQILPGGSSSRTTAGHDIGRIATLRGLPGPISKRSEGCRSSGLVRVRFLV